MRRLATLGAIAMIVGALVSPCRAQDRSSERSSAKPDTLPASFRFPAPGRSASSPAAWPEAETPCGDPLFVALKSRPMETLTPKEFEYFLAQKRACYDYSLDRERMDVAYQRAATAARAANAQESVSAALWVTLGLQVAAGILVGVLASRK